MSGKEMKETSSFDGRKKSIGFLYYLSTVALLVAFIITGLTLTLYALTFQSEFSPWFVGARGHLPIIVKAFTGLYSLSLFEFDLMLPGAMMIVNILLGLILAYTLHRMYQKNDLRLYSPLIFTSGWVLISTQLLTAIMVFIVLAVQPRV
jgi:hypothetical protein